MTAREVGPLMLAIQSACRGSRRWAIVGWRMDWGQGQELSCLADAAAAGNATALAYWAKVAESGTFARIHGERALEAIMDDDALGALEAIEAAATEERRWTWGTWHRALHLARELVRAELALQAAWAAKETTP